MRQCLLYISFLQKQLLEAPLDILAMIQLPPARVGRQAVPVLGDMGKPTMRGIRLLCSAMMGSISSFSIRKCPKCGTYNGTRGLSCKNKQCDMVFKEAEQKNNKKFG